MQTFSALDAVYTSRPALAMVNSDKGITNLHVPSDVIIDASMPAMIRTSGQMWNASGKLQDTKAVIPDRCYAGVYDATFNFCKNVLVLTFDILKLIENTPNPFYLIKLSVRLGFTFRLQKS